MGRVIFKSNVLTIDSRTQYIETIVEKKTTNISQSFRKGSPEITNSEDVKEGRRKYKLIER